MRYPIEPLVAAMGTTTNRALLMLGVSGSRQGPYRREGISERVAENLAAKAGFHVFEIWPEMAEHRLAELPRCAECDDEFVRARKHQRFCQTVCRKRYNGRRNQWRTTPAGREWSRASSARYYAEAGEYIRAQARRRYAERQAS